MRKRRKDDDEETVLPEAVLEEPRRLTPIEVQQKEFRLALRGYNEQDVDDFLDQVTEELARLVEENRRLRELASSSPTEQLAGDLAEASRGAAEIVEEARRQADQILRDAEARAAATPGQGGDRPSGPADAPSVARFVRQERDFLQGIARLVQEHAERVKETAQRARRAAPAPPAAREEPPRTEAASASAPAEPGPSRRGEPGTSFEAEAAAAPAVPVEAPPDLPDLPGLAREGSAPVPPPRGPKADPEASRSSGKADDEEESLRELFWGEE